MTTAIILAADHEALYETFVLRTIPNGDLYGSLVHEAAEAIGELRASGWPDDDPGYRWPRRILGEANRRDRIRWLRGDDRPASLFPDDAPF